METLGSWKRTQYCGELTGRNIGQEVILMGWALRRRDHGGVQAGLALVDLVTLQWLAT